MKFIALGFFIGAAYVDWPWPGPDARERRFGNFCCSLGFVFLVLSML